jgi:hypothetical protein
MEAPCGLLLALLLPAAPRGPAVPGGQLQYLDVQGNRLNASIPAGLANCATLITLPEARQ